MTDEPLILRVTYLPAGRREVEFDILINGKKFKAQKLQRSEQRQREPLVVDYKLPEELIKGREKITVKFAAQDEDQRTGSVAGVRILKEKK